MKALRLINIETKESFVEWEDGLPSVVVLPNGNQVCGAEPGKDMGNGFIIEEIEKPDRPKALTLEQRVAALEAQVAALAIKS